MRLDCRGDAGGTARPVHPGVDPRTDTAEWQIDHVEGGVRLAGRLRTLDAPALIDAIRHATAGVEEPTIDLAGVTFDPSGRRTTKVEPGPVGSSRRSTHRASR